MPKTLVKSDVWKTVLRLPTGESITLNCEVDDNGQALAQIDNSTATVRVYTVDGAILAQYIDNYIIRAMVMRHAMLFTESDVNLLIALVLSAVEEAPGVQVVPSIAAASINYSSDSLF